MKSNFYGTGYARLGKPSDNWLGNYAASEGIRTSGLWNTQHIKAEPLTPEQVKRIEQLKKELVG